MISLARPNLRMEGKDSCLILSDSLRLYDVVYEVAPVDFPSF